MTAITMEINMKMHAASRQNLVEILASRGITQGVLLFRGGVELLKHETDTELPFRQDSWFNYLFGVKEPGFYGTICIETRQATLYIPRLSPDYEIWCGRIVPPDEFRAMYEVDNVDYTDTLAKQLEAYFIVHPQAKCYVLQGLNTDSGNNIAPFTFPHDDHSAVLPYLDTSSTLFETASYSRVKKNATEVELMRYCALVASNAHVTVMRQAHPGIMEYELEAWFLFEIYRVGGCRFSPYTCICACGPNSSTLHYGHAGFPNSRRVQAGEMALLDMGAEYHGYASDITCSFPISGQFTDDQRIIYQGVLAAQRAVLEMMRPGAAWPDCHKAAEREVVKALVLAGVLMGDLEEIIGAELGGVFLPHGLGHLIGCDTHDVGGYLSDCPPRGTAPGLRKLRTSRVLEEGMLLTVEPGCYFIRMLISGALQSPRQSPFINQERLAAFAQFGGVRLEDVVEVTATGARNLTLCPRTVGEVEGVLAATLTWPPVVDEAPWLKRAWGHLSDDGRHIVDDAILAQAT